MPDAYNIHEARLLQEQAASSAANALSVNTSVVPPNKVWTILSMGYWPSAAETKTVWFNLISRAAFGYPVSVPISIALSTSARFPLLTEGMELKLYPGEYIETNRDSATVGSSMNVVYRYIESDLPLYDYVEPQEELEIRKFRRSLVPSKVGGGGRGFSGVVGFGGKDGGSPRPK